MVGRAGGRRSGESSFFCPAVAAESVHFSVAWVTMFGFKLFFRLLVVSLLLLLRERSSFGGDTLGSCCSWI